MDFLYPYRPTGRKFLLTLFSELFFAQELIFQAGRRKNKIKTPFLIWS
jgi:hypothetical protein